MDSKHEIYSDFNLIETLDCKVVVKFEKTFSDAQGFKLNFKLSNVDNGLKEESSCLPKDSILSFGG